MGKNITLSLKQVGVGVHALCYMTITILRHKVNIEVKDEITERQIFT